MGFYNGNKLLSLMDSNGKPPELLFCCGNRTAGKTFFFKRFMLRRFVKHGEKFVVFVRFIDDIANCANGFFADIGPIAFPGHTMTQTSILHGKAAMLYFDKKPCGYVIALNDPERIKRNSALFADAERGFLDEFQSEIGKYVSDEMTKFNSIRISIARGGAKGTHTRYFPVYLCSNNVTVFNPYFDYFRIGRRLTNRTKFLRGDGWVLEQTFNVEASEAIKDKFGSMSERELMYAASNQYLLDNNRFVEKLPGQKRPVFVVDYNGKKYAMWSAERMFYFSEKLPDGCSMNLSFSVNDHDTGNTLTPQSSSLVKILRRAYMANSVRFQNQECKHVFMDCMTLIK